jgi:hypothetical protein
VVNAVLRHKYNLLSKSAQKAHAVFAFKITQKGCFISLPAQNIHNPAQDDILHRPGKRLLTRQMPPASSASLTLRQKAA